MASEGYHESTEKLTSKTKDLHRAVVSITEELDAVDWYRQRADACEDEELREILLHNMREEMEHAAMLIEWARRRDADLDEKLRVYLFTEKPILQVEEEEEAGELQAGESRVAPVHAHLTVGKMEE